MADVYELNTIADLLKIPVKSLDACLRDLRYALELCHFAGGEDTSTMAFDSFAWTDDGRHDIDMSMNGEPFLKLNVTDDAALSHAAGQDGEQCRAASVDSGRLASKLEDVRDGIADVLPIVYLETIDDAIEALRALSRGVPEVEPFVSCTCHEERQKQLCLNKHRCVRAYPLAAIAAQRKEG